MAGNKRGVQLMLLLQLWTGVLTIAVLSLDEGVLTLKPQVQPPVDIPNPDPPVRRDVYYNGKIFDITHLIYPGMPKWGVPDGMGQVVTVTESMKNGSDCYVSEMKLPSHTGTHVDAPSHFFEEYYEKGYDTSTLNLKTLNGPALVVDVPRNSNITAEVMQNLRIPQGIGRVLFRTVSIITAISMILLSQSSRRKLMHQSEFHSDYVGIMKDGAEWIVDNTNIKLVGIDYLSIASYNDAVPTHQALLRSRKIVVVEGLNLDKVTAGIYDLHCLPIRVLGAEGTPTRCILMS
ncbi:hypothetical protein P3X46_013836 [Hevea brasiliensis]|uniref:Cyclase family protein n=1 Tax=Hevea brasiliensis TaxID=3981 RepID=A0ABQ9M754_HEVBR|nr:hypothetical protein P3X46_013836 [Hevea brasiliensis]